MLGHFWCPRGPQKSYFQIFRSEIPDFWAKIGVSNVFLMGSNFGHHFWGGDPRDYFFDLESGLKWVLGL